MQRLQCGKMYSDYSTEGDRGWKEVKMEWLNCLTMTKTIKMECLLGDNGKVDREVKR